VEGSGTAGRILKFGTGGMTAGDSELYQDATGNIGVGTTTAIHQLTVAGGVGADYVQASGASGLDLNTDDSVTRLHISDVGYVGIGHGAPASNLVVKGNSVVGTSYAVNNYAAPSDGLIVQGDVGIGTQSPDYKLDVGGSVGIDAYLVHNDDTNTYLQFSTDDIDLEAGGLEMVNIDASSTQNRVVINDDGGDVDFRVESDASEYGLFVRASDGNVGIGRSSPSAKLDVNGATSTHSLTITGGSDLAEPFVISGEGEPEPGTLVVIDEDNPGGLRISDEPYDRRVAGVVSGAGGLSPGLTMSGYGEALDGHQVALTGRVYCWADASYGAIEPGDRLTTSATQGHAMKATDDAAAAGAVIGKAMTRLDAGQGLVLLLVQPQ
jgi:hypothetical protein